MVKTTEYGQFCPVAKAAEVVTTRWTPLILRELISGSSRFNEIHRGVPLISRALLSKRLKELRAAGVIERRQPEGAQASEYRLTSAGEELRPIIVALGVWGQRWVESALESQDWDAGVLMWDMRRRIDTSVLPEGRTVMQFEYPDAPAELRRWWLVVEGGEVDLCQSEPGFEVDLHVTTSVPVMANVWIGRTSLARALDDEDIVLFGDAELRKSIGRWLMLAKVIQAVKRFEAQTAS